MKRNTFLKKIDINDGPQDTIIDIDHSNSKYILYPTQKHDSIPTIDKNVDKVILEANQKNIGNGSTFVSDIWKNIPNQIYKNDDTINKKEVSSELSKNESTSLSETEKKEDKKEALRGLSELKSLSELRELSKNEDINNYKEEDLLFNLKIISELNQSDKLSYDDKLFCIDRPDYVQGIYRWWYNEDRGKTLERLNNIIDATFNFMDHTFLMQKNNPTVNIDTERMLYETKSQVIQKFYINLINAVKGLEKLKLTYMSDKSMTTGLDILIEKIRCRTDKINEILKNAF